MKALLYKWKSDEVLMLAYQAGNASAFEVLYQRHKDKLFGFLYRSCQDASLVEDIAHEAWVAVIDRAESYRESATFVTWLYRIANNKLVDHWRRKQVRESYAQQQGKIEPIMASQEELSSLEAQQLAERAMAYIKALPISQKQAFLLREMGFSLKEIAEVQEVEVESVKSRLRYASKKLRQVLDDNHGQTKAGGQHEY